MSDDDHIDGVEDIADALSASGAPATSFEVLGEILQKSPAFARYAAQRAATGNPIPSQDRITAAGASTENLSGVELGALLEKRPPFTSYADRPPPARSPMWQKQPLRGTRDWELSFGPVSGPAGSTTTISVMPQLYFRGEKVIASDSATPPGTGTRIMNIMVGAKMQRPNNGGVLTQFYGPNALGGGIKFDTCQPAFAIAMVVSFIVACTFDARMFGKAVV